MEWCVAQRRWHASPRYITLHVIQCCIEAPDGNCSLTIAYAVCFGPSGLGKAHLAIAITMAMIEQDQACRFFPATALVQLLLGQQFWRQAPCSL